MHRRIVGAPIPRHGGTLRRGRPLVHGTMVTRRLLGLATVWLVLASVSAGVLFATGRVAAATAASWLLSLYGLAGILFLWGWRTERESLRELAESRDAYRDLTEGARDLIWAIDARLRWTYVNETLARFFGRPAEEIVGRPVATFLLEHPASSDIEAALRRAAAGETVPAQLLLCATAAGPRWVEALATAIFAPDGTLTGVRGISRDVTERVHAEALLRESEEKFRTLAEAMAAAVFIVQGTGLRYVNAAAIAMTGYAPEELLGMPFWDIVHPDERPIVRERGEARQRREAVPRSAEYRILTKGGEERWVAFTGVPIQFEGRPAFLGTSIDISEQKRAENALRTSLERLQRREEELRSLAQRQAAIRDDERKRLGFDLHDGVCQELIGVGILVESARQRFGSVSHELEATLERASGYVTEVVEHLRVLARELRPILLLDLGLEGSLCSLAAGMSTPDRPVTCTVRTPIPRMAEAIELGVYRIAQEALANAARHACARTITLTLEIRDAVLLLTVRDDGRGFDPSSRGRGALGQRRMEERALGLGGSLEIESAVEQGTTVLLRCPLARQEPATAA